MLKCLCLGLTNEHYQDDTRLFRGTRLRSFPLASAAFMLRVAPLCDLKHQARFNSELSPNPIECAALSITGLQLEPYGSALCA